MNATRQRGFTLIELMVAIVILAILLGIALPSFRTWLMNAQIRNAAESIQNGLQRARGEAVSRNTNVEFVLALDSSWVVQLADGTDIESRPASEGSRNVIVTPVPAGTTTVTFTNFGGVLAANADASAPFTQVDIDSSVLPASESQDLSVTLGTGGSIRMCDPHAASGTPRAC